jgi:hypothetical protein
MANADIVLAFIHKRGSRGVTNADIVAGTAIKPHQQVFQITKSLLNAGKISGRLYGSEWIFFPQTSGDEVKATAAAATAIAQKEEVPAPRKFERLCQEVMSAHFGTELHSRLMTSASKNFDLVSSDGSICGDAKYFTLVRGSAKPPAKFSIIAEHVWLLENVNSSKRFLVFGNDIRVPTLWLKKYGHIKRSVEFFFLADDGQLQKID